MKISDVLTPEMSLCDLTWSSKKKVFENLAQFISLNLEGGADRAEALLQSMVARERLGSTGIGQGVAVPHCRVTGITRVYGCIIKLNLSIDYDALDQQPVDLIFALVVPMSIMMIIRKLYLVSLEFCKAQAL
tara:strand:+ start:205 stop:600 length:396 start_codon:yes stop_codon:yes gene_type:complete